MSILIHNHCASFYCTYIHDSIGFAHFSSFLFLFWHIHATKNNGMGLLLLEHFPFSFPLILILLFFQVEGYEQTLFCFFSLISFLNINLFISFPKFCSKFNLSNFKYFIYKTLFTIFINSFISKNEHHSCSLRV